MPAKLGTSWNPWDVLAEGKAAAVPYNDHEPGGQEGRRLPLLSIISDASKQPPELHSHDTDTEAEK